MSIKRIADDFSITEQTAPSDLHNIKEFGFRTIINNRGDGEDDDQDPSK